MSRLIAENKKPFVWIEINLDHLAHNLRVIVSKLRDATVEVLAIVKADAYGHGMKPVALALERAGVRCFGVANLDEALSLRRALPHVRILVLGSFHPSQIPLYQEHAIRPSVSSFEDLALIRRALKDSQTVLPVHVKIDTGMGRLGVYHTEVPRFFKKIKKSGKIFVEGIYTHFSSADKKSTAFTERQIRIFNRAIHQVRSLGIQPLYFHAANSMALVRFQNSHLNLVRPGILLYGLNPQDEYSVDLPLKPVLSLKTRIVLLKQMKAGVPISYGATYRTKRRTTIAVLPIGYSYGYRVAFSNNAYAIIHGKRYPVVGRVTMDLTLVDLGRATNVRRWDEVTLIGSESGASVSAEELARAAHTIPYEIVCALHSRIPRIYKGIQ